MSDKVIIDFVKTHPDAQIPTKAYEGDNCWDLYAVEDVCIPSSETVPDDVGVARTSDFGYKSNNVQIGNAVVPVGLSVGFISPGFGFVIKGRSGLGFKHGIIPHFGEIDNGYRGDLGVKLYNLTGRSYHVKKGDRVAQFKIERIYDAEVSFTLEADKSERGANKFGSSGA